VCKLSASRRFFGKFWKAPLVLADELRLERMALARRGHGSPPQFFQIHASVFVQCCVPTPDDLGLPGIAAACRSMNFFVAYRSLEPGGDVKTHNMDTADLAALEV